MEKRDKLVYAHVDNKGRIFYIGKGDTARAHCRNRNNSRWLEAAGVRREHAEMHHSKWSERYYKLDYDVMILKDNLTDCEAKELEMFVINEIKDKYKLTNRRFK